MNNRDRVRRRWNYFAGDNTAVWQFMFTGSGRLVGQKRMREERRSLFFSIDVHSGLVLFDDYLLADISTNQAVGDSWFTGIETVSEHLVFLHGWQQNSPEHLGIWAIDPDTGSIVWARRDAVYCGMLEEGLLVYRPAVFAGFPERTYLVIDALTGSELRRPDSDSKVINAMRSSFVPEAFRQNVILPDIVTAGSTAYDLLKQSGFAIPEHCECLVSGSLVVAACHEPEGSSGLWRSVLRIWSGREMRYEDIMSEHSGSPPVNSFLLRRGVLYYIRSETELIALDV